MPTYKISGHTLHTDIKLPPYDNDWMCTDDNYEAAPDSGKQVMGTGETELEAIGDWIQQYIEEYLP